MFLFSLSLSSFVYMSSCVGVVQLKICFSLIIHSRWTFPRIPITPVSRSFTRKRNWRRSRKWTRSLNSFAMKRRRPWRKVLAINISGYERVWKRAKSRGLCTFERSVREAEEMFSFKLDRRKILIPSLAHGRVTKRKPRASLSKCLIKIRGVKFHTHPNGKCLQRLSKRLLREKTSVPSLCSFGFG